MTVVHTLMWVGAVVSPAVLLLLALWLLPLVVWGPEQETVLTAVPVVVEVAQPQDLRRAVMVARTVETVGLELTRLGQDRGLLPVSLRTRR
jgi:hypothetical protein